MPRLYTYYRSSCSYRVRIALALKGIECEFVYINLKPDVSEQLSPHYLQINPQGRVPYFVDGDIGLSQSPAILEFLEEQYPEIPLLPDDLSKKAAVRELVNIIACDVQPINNLAVLQTLKRSFSATEEETNAWYALWVKQGFQAIENLLRNASCNGLFCFGDEAGLADVYLIPQVWNAHRFDVDVENYPLIHSVYEHCRLEQAFKMASPERQQDAV